MIKLRPYQRDPNVLWVDIRVRSKAGRELRRRVKSPVLGEELTMRWALAMEKMMLTTMETDEAAATEGAFLESLEEAGRIGQELRRNSRLARVPTVVARIVWLFRRSGLSLKQFCFRTRCATPRALHHSWPELCEARGRPTSPAPSSGVVELPPVKRPPQGIKPVERVVIDESYPRATPITMWRDADGGLHDDPKKADAASRRTLIGRVAAHLADFIANHDSKRVKDALTDEVAAQYVFALADAFKANRAA